MYELAWELLHTIMIDVRHKSEICPFGNISLVLRDLPLDPLTPGVKRPLGSYLFCQRCKNWCHGSYWKQSCAMTFFLPQTFPFCEIFTFKLGNLCFPTKKIETFVKSINWKKIKMKWECVKKCHPSLGTTWVFGKYEWNINSQWSLSLYSLTWWRKKRPKVNQRLKAITSG